MESCVKTIAPWGRVLWLTDGVVEVGAALDFGIRIVHLSCAGMENLFYRQPEDGSDGFTTAGGWRLRGGHRLWMAPECDDTYCPDNDPVDCTQEGNSILLEQAAEPLLGICKRIRVTLEGGGAVLLEQSIENCSGHPIEGASWGVNTLDRGGVAVIPFAGSRPGDYAPRRFVTLWADTDLHDPRLRFTKDALTARHLPSQAYCKLGLFSREGRAVFENKGQRLELTFGAEPGDYADGGCNFELYMNDRFLELETLGFRTAMAPGARASHWERWRLASMSE